jgi:2'-5' RNA ligase
MDTIRTFIAVALSKQLKEELSRIQTLLKETAADVKWVEPENLHLTLKFLGAVNQDKIKKIEEALKNDLRSFGPFPLRLERLDAFPNAGAPRVIWVAASKDSEKLKRLSQVVEDSLVSVKFAKEKRGFKTHITLGRVRSAKNRSALTAAFQTVQTQPKEMSVDSITIFKSILSSSGPRYESLAVISLQN